ncbi:ubiquitin-like domain-containing protein [Paenibacillus doosanensis]|uniref:Cell wall-binding protein YocH n=1 Tax=Paenibacillus konkukensis TaxID=2020716 RepID=A0ABY4RSG1_9BACL|nr:MULTISPECIES: 3D domain-containing protein [Paenibacillus]MCS7463217.1 ubiquitin-like domain-containing protein [Paenibacillus doosanensis]UQZ84895.1 Cell wall-binding protein YocH precursor [Paenibacillus konkukensis]
MGAIQHEQTHVRRSSSMSFALRWKHENLRMISTTALISFALTFMFLIMLYGTATKKVTVVVNGQETVVYTKQWDLQRLLDEQQIQVGEHDRLSAALDSKVKTGDRITIDHAKPVQLTADGETKTIYTVAKTVGDALHELNVPVGELDKVSPELEASLPDSGAVQIVRVKKELEEVSEKIAFDVVKKNDPQLVKGKEQVVQEGQEGEVLKKKEKRFEDGVLVSEQVVDQQVKTEKVNKVVAVGTKNPVVILSASSPNLQEVTKSGVSFGVKQVINNVTLTAYSAGAASTGKSAEHPQYGVTSTGTRVTEGRTIAVDPKVVPLGWWVYIDGLGFRRAEDTGSAVKGNIIDVYFDSNDYANRFGMKRGYTVYVIGPKKPTAD